MASDYSINVRARLDTSLLESQLKGLTIRDVRVDGSAIASSIQNALNGQRFTLNLNGVKIDGLSAQLQRSGADAAQQFTRGFQGSAGNVGNVIQQQLSGMMTWTSNSADSIRQLQSALAQANFSGGSIQQITSDLERMDFEVTQVKANFTGNGGLRLNVQGVDSMGRAISMMQEYKEDSDELIRSSQQVTQAFQTQAQAQNTLLRGTKLSNNMDTWMNKNALAAKAYGDQIKNLQSQLKGNTNAEDIRRIGLEFQTLRSQAEAAGLAVEPFGRKLATSIKYALGVGSTMMVITKTIQLLKDMAKQVTEIDKQMTELKKVTNETPSSYSAYLNNAGETAKKIGTTISDYVSSTADFARLGYSFKESAELAKVANIYSVVGDEIDGIEDATKSVISTMTAFKREMQPGESQSDFATNIIDKFNEVGNNFAISSGGIGEAMKRSASSFAAANNTLDESIALVTAANTVVQNPESVGKQTCRH